MKIIVKIVSQQEVNKNSLTIMILKSGKYKQSLFIVKKFGVLLK